VIAIDPSGALGGIAVTDGTSGTYLVSIANPGTYNICVMPSAATLAWECYPRVDWDGFGSPRRRRNRGDGLKLRNRARNRHGGSSIL
jgi:hypothetical protein